MRKLEDDYHVWINVPIGPKQFRPDFVVLHPGRGILVLEVKDWKLSTIRQIDPQTVALLTDRGLVNTVNPIVQARSYATAITALLEKDPLLIQQEEGRYKGHLLFPWGYGVVLTNITRKQFEECGMADAIPADRVICQDEMTETVDAEEIQQRLWNMFSYCFGGILTMARIDRVRWHLFPEIRIHQGKLFEHEADPNQSVLKTLPDVVKIMDFTQEKIARNLGEGHRIVHGVAGSGKTLLLAYRCLHLSKQPLKKPILVLCFNRTLASKLREMLFEKGAGDSVHVRHFHGWCKDMCDLYQLDLAKDERPAYEKHVEAVIKGADQGRVPRSQYAALLIDEGHDFEPEWFKLLVQMIDPETNSLLLLYDDAQNIYGKHKRRATSWASLGIEAQGRRTTILKVNYRNTVEALDFSYRFLSAYVDETKGTEEFPMVHPEFGGRTGPTPEVMRLANLGIEMDHIATWLKKRATDGIPYRDMAILCRFNKQIDQYGLELAKRDIPVEQVSKPGRQQDAIRFLTIHSSKGLEFHCVVIPDLGAMPYQRAGQDEEARLLYVGMTRSTHHLLLTHHSDSVFTRHCTKLQTAARPAMPD